MLEFNSSVFEKELATFGDKQEWIVKGGRHLLAKLPEAFKNIKQIGVIGWGSQGPAQAQNLRDSLEGTAIKVVVGLRENSSSIPLAEAAGFSQANGTLAEMFEVVKTSDLVMFLVSDAAQTKLYKHVFDAMKPGATLGLSHGFLLGHLDSVGEAFPSNINVVAVCPKGMGPSVRRLYEQGKEVNGAGINCSFAVHQDVSGDATDIALGWAVGLGAPFSFQTTMRDEYRSDIFGERGILLGAVHGICEATYRWFRENNTEKEAAFLQTAACITGPISEIMSKQGLKAVYDSFEGEAKEQFKQAYSAAYHPSYEILWEIYDEVYSGNEIRGVILADERMEKYPMGKIDGTEMWQVGESLRSSGNESTDSLHPVTAGVHMACMMAQVDLLIAKGHCYSEIANESIIEAVDSLYPYMAYKGVAFMVDNCSTTARLGSRKWAPRFDYILSQLAFSAIDQNQSVDPNLISDFETHIIHDVMKTCSSMRPSVDIAVKEPA